MSELADRTIEEAFPYADPGAKPFGAGVLVQLRTPKRFSAAGIALPEESQEQERWMTTIGKVISFGPLAYRDRDDPKAEWPEGSWCKEGDFVRCPKWGGDRWEIPTGKTDGRNPVMARFVIYKDRELMALITGDPLSFVDYL